MVLRRPLAAALIALIVCAFSFVAAEAAGAEGSTATFDASDLEPAAMIPAQAPPAADANEGISTWVLVAGSLLFGAGIITTISAIPFRPRKTAGTRIRLGAVGFVAA